jgi:hypothetical protein
MLRDFLRGSGARMALAMVAVLVAVAAGLALTACGDDDDASDEGTTTAVESPEATYADGLASAASASAALGEAVISGDSGEDTATQIREAAEDWQSAIDGISDLELSDPLAGQRDALVDASPDFVDAWNEVADEWEENATNGVLQLVQRRDPILAGLDALGTAIGGAIEETGAAIQSELEGAQDELNEALEEITSESS